MTPSTLEKPITHYYEPKNYQHLLGAPGFSDKLLKDHFKLYEAYVKNTNQLLDFFESIAFTEEYKDPKFSECKRRFGWEYNGMRLHEYYFGNLASSTQTLDSKSALHKKIIKDFGSFEEWKTEFTAIGAMRGIGWVILTYDEIADRLLNHWVNEHDTGFLAGSTPLLVMDVWEHAFWSDYGTDRSKYISSFMNAIGWSEVQKRFHGSGK